jgi:NADPH-dependent 7-cyano-7-deazaguanine reductase QueF
MVFLLKLYISFIEKLEKYSWIYKIVDKLITYNVLLFYLRSFRVIYKICRHAPKNCTVGLKRHCLPYYLEIYFYPQLDNHIKT